VPDATTLEIGEIGSFHVGGRRVTLENLPTRDLYYTDSTATPLTLDSNGDYQVEQMYVQYVKLARPKARYPLLMLHGGRSTGVVWETTPDGRPGFQMLFLRYGHDVYTSDAVERGRAGWAPPQVWNADPYFPAAKGTWELGRIGPPGSYATDPADRRPYAGTRFPVAAFDQQMKQRVPRWTTNDAATQSAYDEYLRRIGPCVIMAHSTGGPFAIRMALRAPEKVKALILLEPAGAPDPSSQSLLALKDLPHLYVWGDNTRDEPSMRTTIPLAEAWRDALLAVGAHVEWTELPTLGITGNTHGMMMDLNNAEIAQLIQAWLAERGLMN
jgi:pimeloyl-ACP methyl ester carboxylesterase